MFPRFPLTLRLWTRAPSSSGGACLIAIAWLLKKKIEQFTETLRVNKEGQSGWSCWVFLSYQKEKLVIMPSLTNKHCDVTVLRWKLSNICCNCWQQSKCFMRCFFESQFWPYSGTNWQSVWVRSLPEFVYLDKLRSEVAAAWVNNLIVLIGLASSFIKQWSTITDQVAGPIYSW